MKFAQLRPDSYDHAVSRCPLFVMLLNTETKEMCRVHCQWKLVATQQDRQIHNTIGVRSDYNCIMCPALSTKLLLSKSSPHTTSHKCSIDPSHDSSWVLRRTLLVWFGLGA